MLSLRDKKYLFLLIGIVALLTLLAVVLRPRQLFDDPVCAVLESSDGHLLGARIAADGPWRFPAADTVPGSANRRLVSTGICARPSDITAIRSHMR